MQVQSRQGEMLKINKRCTLTLVDQLYSKLELRVQVANKLKLIRRVVPPTEAATRINTLRQHQ